MRRRRNPSLELVPTHVLVGAIASRSDGLVCIVHRPGITEGNEIEVFAHPFNNPRLAAIYAMVLMNKAGGAVLRIASEPQ